MDFGIYALLGWVFRGLLCSCSNGISGYRTAFSLLKRAAGKWIAVNLNVALDRWPTGGWTVNVPSHMAVRWVQTRNRQLLRIRATRSDLQVNF